MKVKLTFKKDGTVNHEVFEVVGQECAAEAQRFLNSFGGNAEEIVEAEKKPEYYQDEVVVGEHQKL